MHFEGNNNNDYNMTTELILNGGFLMSGDGLDGRHLASCLPEGVGEQLDGQVSLDHARRLHLLQLSNAWSQRPEEAETPSIPTWGLGGRCQISAGHLLRLPRLTESLLI